MQFEKSIQNTKYKGKVNLGNNYLALNRVLKTVETPQIVQKQTFSQYFSKLTETFIYARYQTSS